jgi:hypothetical protein
MFIYSLVICTLFITPPVHYSRTPLLFILTFSVIERPVGFVWLAAEYINF